MMKRVVVGVVKRGDRYLLMSTNEDFGEYTGFYYPPGGHCKEGENEEQALKREFKEELGIEIKIVKRLAETPGDVENQITDWWEVRWVSGELKVNSGEDTRDIVWMTKKEIEESNNIWPATKKFFHDKDR